MPPAPPTSPLPRRVVTALGALSLALSLLGAWRTARRLDREERVEERAAQAVSAWQTGTDASLVLGSFRAPDAGQIRVRVCAAAPLRGLSLAVHDGPRALARVEATANTSLARSCVDAAWSTARSARVTLSLRAPRPAPLTSVTVRSGGSLSSLDALALLGVLVGVSMLVLGPRLAPREDDGVVDALPSPGSLPAVMRGDAGLVIALVALLAVNVGSQAPVLYGGLRGETVLASLVLQQLVLAGAAMAMLGALTQRPVRRAVELTRPPAQWPATAAVWATGLLALALTVTLAMPHAGESHLAKAVESMPMRYVIALGAVCAPLPEELFFRGLLGRLVSRITGDADDLAAVIAPAALFTLMHALQLEGARLGLVPIAAVGLANGWLRRRTRGLVVPWAVHTLYNLALALPTFFATG